MEKQTIVVVGAGPAGLMSAIRAGQLESPVILLEKNSSAGRKLLLSGKGRCNLTNTSDLDDFLARFSDGGQFLRDAFKKFFHPELMDFFISRGLPLKVERQGRVFPESDRSSSILDVLLKELAKNKVNIRYGAVLKDILIRDGGVCGVVVAPGTEIATAKLILATGGVSYRATGSTGEGLRLAEKTGHRIRDLVPGLVPLITKETTPKRLEGLTLKNIRLRFSDGKKEIVTDIGELLFTDFGISGPLVLTYSGRIADWLKKGKKVFVEIDLKPALESQQLQARLLRDIQEDNKKNARNFLKGLLPLRMIDIFTEMLHLAPAKKANQITQEERRALAGLLKAFKLHIEATRPMELAMVTRGGVSLKDIDPRTMESRKVKGLYFAGEMIDVAADTGGFNLQAAFSTGYLAGESAASAP